MLVILNNRQLIVVSETTPGVEQLTHNLKACSTDYSALYSWYTDMGFNIPLIHSALPLINWIDCDDFKVTNNSAFSYYLNVSVDGLFSTKNHYSEDECDLFTQSKITNMELATDFVLSGEYSIGAVVARLFKEKHILDIDSLLSTLRLRKITKTKLAFWTIGLDDLKHSIANYVILKDLSKVGRKWKFRQVNLGGEPKTMALSELTEFNFENVNKLYR